MSERVRVTAEAVEAAAKSRDRSKKMERSMREVVVCGLQAWICHAWSNEKIAGAP
jgi:hypothetical protein